MDRLRNIGLSLADVTRKYAWHFERQGRESSSDLPTYRALADLEKHEGISQIKLAEIIGVTPVAMARILTRLEADGLVRRRPDPTDRRARRLYLTPKSKPALAEMWHLADRISSQAFAGISQSERDVFLDVLNRLECNLGTLKTPSVEAALDTTRISAPAPRTTRGNGRPSVRRVGSA
jgi:MarR family transcriptional regulator for hemolysin